MYGVGAGPVAGVAAAFAIVPGPCVWPDCCCCCCANEPVGGGTPGGALRSVADGFWFGCEPFCG